MTSLFFCEQNSFFPPSFSMVHQLEALRNVSRNPRFPRCRHNLLEPMATNIRVHICRVFLKQTKYPCSQRGVAFWAYVDVVVVLTPLQLFFAPACPTLKSVFKGGRASHQQPGIFQVEGRKNENPHSPSHCTCNPLFVDETSAICLL